MFSYSQLLLGLPVIFLLVAQSGAAHEWTWELIDVEHTTSDPNKVDSDLRARNTRDGAVINGSIYWKFDATEDTTIEMVVLSSYDDLTFVTEPLHVRKQSLFAFLGSPEYQEVLYPTIAHCSNFPKVEGAFEAPLARQTFTVNSCEPNIETLPHQSKGSSTYKAVFKIEGEVSASFTIRFKAPHKVSQ